MKHLHRLLAPLLLCVTATTAAAQDFPSRAVRIVVPYPPGSGTDIVARALAQKLSETWPQSAVVDNKPGAGAIIGVETVAKAAPDGYTIGIADTGPLAINPALYAKLPYDPRRDFAPVTLVANLPFVLVVNPSLPVKNVRELIALAKSQPGKLNYASVGNGSAVHLATELFKKRAGIDMTHVPYKGSAPALQGLVSGDTPVMFVNLLSAAPLVQAGKVRMLAAAPGTRIAALPDLPTVAEAGVPGFEYRAWFGMVAPAGTPAPVLERLNRDLRAAIASPSVREVLEKGGFEPVGSSADEFARLIPAEIERWGRLVRETDAKVE